MAHHHLAIAFIFLIAGHMYRTNFGIGHSINHTFVQYLISIESNNPPTESFDNLTDAEEIGYMRIGDENILVDGE
jgi:hypothetical protein